MSSFKEFYTTEVVPKLQETFGYKNVMQIPRLEKIVLNMGLGEAISNIKIIDSAVEELKLISGQQPVIRRARKSIAAFKLRQGMPVGCMVTLRHERMYDFFNKLVNIALPRVRDFRGIPGHAFDGQGNYTLGVREQIIFPEIEYDKIDKIKGLNITIVTSVRKDDEARELLRLMGMPFKN
jgi:large subunit ribosomal protein L5